MEASSKHDNPNVSGRARRVENRLAASRAPRQDHTQNSAERCGARISPQVRVMLESLSMVSTIWRRHTAKCPHRHKGRMGLNCKCPLWADGYRDGQRLYRMSLRTRDQARARKKATDLESENRVFKAVPDAVKTFLEHCRSRGLADGTIKKYRTRSASSPTSAKRNRSTHWTN